MAFGEHGHRGKVPFASCVSRVPTIHVTYSWWCWTGVDHLAEIVFVSLLHEKLLFFPPLCILYSLEGSHGMQSSWEYVCVVGESSCAPCPRRWGITNCLELCGRFVNGLLNKILKLISLNWMKWFCTFRYKHLLGFFL